MANVIIDSGAYMTKAGFSGDDAPSCVFHTCYARAKEIVGTEALKMEGALEEGSLTFPMGSAGVKDWESTERIWNYTFKSELRHNSEESSVLLTESALNPKDDRAKMCELFFESLGSSRFHLAKKDVLALYHYGKDSGVSINFGQDHTTVVPVFEGQIGGDVKVAKVGGGHLSAFMMEIMGGEERFNNPVLRRSMDLLKENVCYVAEEFEAAEDSAEEKPFELPDGSVITPNVQRFQCPELLFKPQLNNIESIGLIDAALGAISSCDLDLHKDLWGNIVVDGSGSMIPGMKERLTKELAIASNAEEFGGVNVTGNYNYAAWCGASKMSSLPTFESSWITKEEYGEEGAEVVNRRA